MAQAEHQLWSTLVLNAAPLAICLYITFFGRFVDDLLRMVSIFFIVSFPIAAEAVRPYLQGEALNFAQLNVTDATALAWAVVAGCAAMYSAARRQTFGVRLQLVGVAFAAVMTLNSFYIGLLHSAVSKSLPGVSQFFDWFNFAFVIVGAVALSWARALPIAGEIVASAVCASIGGFMTLQQITYIGRDLKWDITEGLELKKLLNEEFGCTPKSYSSCVTLMSVMIGITAAGALTQHMLYQHHIAVQKGKKSILSFGLAKWLYNKVDSGGGLETLFNVNKLIANMAKGLSGEEERHQGIELQRDLYKLLGIFVDVVLVVYSLGLLTHMGEMAWKGVFSDAGTNTFVSLMFLVATVLCLAVAAGAMYLRYGGDDIGSVGWKEKSTKYLLGVAVVWPLLLFAYVFSGIIGGEEIALLDVPFVNQAAGFGDLPLGCDSLIDDNADEETWCAWVDGQAGVGTTNMWDAPEALTPGGGQTLRIDEHGEPSETATVATADACAQAAAIFSTYSNHDIDGATWGLAQGETSTRLSCYAVWGSDTRFENDMVPTDHAPDPASTWQTCTLPEDKVAEVSTMVDRRCSDGIMNYGEKGVDCGGACAARCGACQCSYTGKSGLVDVPFNAADGNMCGTHLNGTNGVIDSVYVCYVHEPNSCSSPDSEIYEHQETEYESLGAEWVFCSPSVNEAEVQSECDGSAPAFESAAPARREVFLCDGPICHACTTEECLVGKCNTFQILKAYFPMTVKILFALVVAAVSSMVTISGELGGFYLFATRFTIYITTLNLVQGLLLVVFGAIMEFRSLPENFEQEGRKTYDSLVEGEASIFRVVILGGLLLVTQSFLGLLGVCFESKKVGGGCLRLYLASVVVTLCLFIGVFGGAMYYILNIDALIDRDWEFISQKLQEGNNETAVDALNDITRISKEEFVAYAKGLFRMIYIIGMWFVGYTTVLLVVTRYTVNMRTSEEAEHAREMKKMNNPMFDGDEMTSPISAAGTAAGLAAAVASGTVGKALDVVDAGIGVAEGAAELTGDGVDAINPIDVKGAVKGNAED